MQPIFPSRATFLGKPTKPSRLFVLLFIVSALANALLLINFGYWESRLLVERQSWKNNLQLVENQATTYKQERDLAQEDIQKKDARLADLDKQLSETTTQLATLNTRLKTQESQLAKNSAELQALRSRPPLFKFESATARDVTQDKADVEAVVTKAFTAIEALYGQPYILHQITISFVDSLSIPGAVGEITIENSAEGISITIKITDFSKDDPECVDTIIHEIIHAFHGLAAFNAPVTEEGITVAATDSIMATLAAQGVIAASTPFISLSDAEAASLNSTLGPPPADSSFYDLPKSTVQQYYELAGWSWQQLAQEDADFFRNFNEALYEKVANGNRPTPTLIRTLVSQVKPTVRGESTATWLTSQVIFNPS
jgi:uncharacterized coiled-coil protein SlyX